MKSVHYPGQMSHTAPKPTVTCQRKLPLTALQRKTAPGHCPSSGGTLQSLESFEKCHYPGSTPQILISRVWLILESEVRSLSRVRLFVTPWTVAYRAPPSMGFSRQEYWSGLPFPSPIWGLIFKVIIDDYFATWVENHCCRPFHMPERPSMTPPFFPYMQSMGPVWNSWPKDRQDLSWPGSFEVACVGIPKTIPIFRNLLQALMGLNI